MKKRRTIVGLKDLFKKKDKNTVVQESDGVNGEIKDEIEDEQKEDAVALIVEEISSIQIDRGALVEITDKSLLSRIDSLVPISTSSADVAQSIKLMSEPVYMARLEQGGQLVNSRNMAGAKRAFTSGKNGIRENANLVRVDTTKNAVSSVGSSVMGVASMVVGQYYMKQVDDKIAALQTGIEDVMDFLDIQYKSQIVALMEVVLNATKFQMSNLENEELRKRELDNIEAYQKQCLELIAQAEMNVRKLTQTVTNDYEKYIKTTSNIGKWLKFQQILMQLLNQISIIDYTLYGGVKSREQSFAYFDIHNKKLSKCVQGLIAWHKEQCETLKIELDDKRRKKLGFIEHFDKLITKLNDEWKYKEIDDETLALIQGQMQAEDSVPSFNENPFDEGVQIIVIGNKKYYLPNKNNCN